VVSDAVRAQLARPTALAKVADNVVPFRRRQA
jgi:hypothetical protein